MKLKLKLGQYCHAPATWAVPDRPLRLERNPMGKTPYWTMVRDGEYHWWLTQIEHADPTFP
jgi:hypothetical protein